MFNPVCLALYLVLDGFERLDRAAAFYAVFHIGLLGAGTYALGRSIGTGRPFAVLGGLAGATCFGIVDWGAVSWVPGLVSAAWLTWAAAFLMWAGRDGRFVPPAALAVFLVVASGWPFADAALLAGVGACLVAGAYPGGTTGADRRAGIRVLLATGLGFALAAPAWMPLAAAIGSTARLAASFDPHQWQTPLPTLVAIGVPSSRRPGRPSTASRSSPRRRCTTWAGGSRSPCCTARGRDCGRPGAPAPPSSSPRPSSSASWPPRRACPSCAGPSASCPTSRSAARSWARGSSASRGTAGPPALRWR
ncbi:hypothetical protein [Methylobacterium gregans]|uniref:hypothetical protein n=1 Tax=Methylobacterium gregans TaxID=374424 RepID=UPI00360FFB82